MEMEERVLWPYWSWTQNSAWPACLAKKNESDQRHRLYTDTVLAIEDILGEKDATHFSSIVYILQFDTKNFKIHGFSVFQPISRSFDMQMFGNDQI